MGWTNSHLYEIRARDVGWSTPDPYAGWAGDFLDARKARLDEVLEDVGTKQLRYTYDFGDGWEHTIKIERLIDPEPGQSYPRLIEASGRCPPEDIGGPWAMLNCWKRSTIPHTNATPTSVTGYRTTSTQPLLISNLLPRRSRPLPRSGRESLPANDPRKPVNKA